MATVTPMTVVDDPGGGGQPLAEAWSHIRATMLLHQALEDFFQNRPDVLVASDLTWYWEEGNPRSAMTPDLMVVPISRPRDERERRSFMSWEEGGAIPAVVFEIVSGNSWQEDWDEKYHRYQEQGVREYFLFDPEGEALRPRLQGYRLSNSAYRRLKQSEMESELGFGLQVEEAMLRLIDSRTGRPIYTRAEAVAVERDRADSALLQAAAEQQRADSLQKEVDRLKALLQKHGHGNGGTL